MLRKNSYNIIGFIVKIVQIGLMIGIGVLQKFTHTSAGVNHHLHFRRVRFISSYYTNTNRIILIVLLAVLFTGLLILIWKYRIKAKPLVKVEMILMALFIVFMVATLTMGYFKKLLVFPYLLLGEGIVFLLELLTLILVFRGYRKK